MSGGGCALDGAGHIFAVAGNGAFDNLTEFGESCIKYAYTPAAAGNAASLAVAGWTTRFTDTGNVAGTAYQTLADTSLIPTSVFDADDQTNGSSNMDSPDDMDECSGVTILLASVTGFTTDLSFYSGKGGIGILSDAASPPNPTLAAFAADTIQAEVYDKLAAITGFTDGFGYPAGMDITPTDLQQLQTTFGGKTHHFHATAAHYQSPTQGCLLYGGGENGAVRCFQVSEPTPGRFLMTYLGTGTALASPNVPVARWHARLADHRLVGRSRAGHWRHRLLVTLWQREPAGLQRPSGALRRRRPGGWRARSAVGQRGRSASIYI